MNSFAVRFLIGQILLGGGLAFGQAWVTEPNRAVAGSEQMQTTAARPETVVKARGVAEVTYANGLLRVAADNSSLDEILRSIARETGMKITGGVKDESVYGTYGPSTAGRVLASLLDGTGSNAVPGKFVERACGADPHATDGRPDATGEPGADVAASGFHRDLRAAAASCMDPAFGAGSARQRAFDTG